MRISEEEAARRKKRILEAARLEFGERGFHRSTTRAIAKRAGVAEGSLYNYFSNKEGLLLGLLHDLNESEEREESFAQALAQPLRPFLKGYIQHRLMVMFSQKATFRALLPELLTNAGLREKYISDVVGPTFETATPLFETLIAQGRLLPMEVVPHLRMMASTIFGMLMLELLGDNGTSENWEEWPERLMKMYFDPWLPDTEMGTNGGRDECN